MEISEEEKMNFNCEDCNKSFSTEGALEMHKKAKHLVVEKKPILSQKARRKIRNWSIAIIVILLMASGIFFLSNKKSLPPTDMEGHIEASPPSHVLKEPMQISVQKHMLEHADGSGPPGVIINYDCISHRCNEELIPKLEGFAEKYPSFVYVAPYNNMAVKIALTRQNQILTLDSYDGAAIENFVNRR